MIAAKKKACMHPSMHFERGGLCIACDRCKYTWVAVGKNMALCSSLADNSVKVIVDQCATFMGLDESDHRCDIFGRK